MTAGAPAPRGAAGQPNTARATAPAAARTEDETGVEDAPEDAPGDDTPPWRVESATAMTTPRPVAATAGNAAVADDPAAMPDTFEGLVALVAERREGRLHAALVGDVRGARYAPGEIDLALAPGASGTLAQELSGRLRQVTGAPWRIAVVDGGGATTIAEQRRAGETAKHEAAALHPTVAAVLAAFPGAAIEAVRPLLPDPDMDGDGDEDGYADDEARASEG